MGLLRIYIGYDEREAVGYPVFCSSVLRRTRERVSFEPMRGVRREASSTGFDHTRWDVPGLCGYRGIALWAECDMLARADVAELLDLFDPRYDVMLVPHDYRTKFPVKFLGQKNEDYPRKNQSSFMLFNNSAAVWQRLDELRRQKPVNPGNLHAFPKFMHGTQLFEDDRIGALPMEWNWLSLEYDHNPDAKIVHHTIGLPCWEPYATIDPYADEWRAEREAMLAHAPDGISRG